MNVYPVNTHALGRSPESELIRGEDREQVHAAFARLIAEDDRGHAARLAADKAIGEIRVAYNELARIARIRAEREGRVICRGARGRFVAPRTDVEVVAEAHQEVPC